MATAALNSQDRTFSRRASSRPEWSASAIKALDKAVAEFDIVDSNAWTALDALSNNTIVDGIFPHSESAMFQSGRFVVPATIGVTLNYGENDDALQLTDSFPADIVFDLVVSDRKPSVKILDVNVDTRSFFE